MKAPSLLSIALATTVLGLGTNAMAKSKAPELVKCEESLGTIALVEGSQAGWSEWKLGSPRALLNTLAIESGCFTPHNAADEKPARFLVTAIAGSQEDVDQGIELAKTGASEALLRSGAAGKVLSKVPMGGALVGAFGMFGGKKKTVAAGLSVVSPVNGQTLATGSGTVKKSTLNFRGSGGAWANDIASSAGYQSSKNGKMLTEAYILAFNEIVAQRNILQAAPAAAAPEPAKARTAVDTVMRTSPAEDGETVRTLRAGSELSPTGERSGLFIEVTDNYGTRGWVSVEDME